MKKILFILIALCGFIEINAQAITEGTKWFDGKVLYTAHILDNGEIYFDAVENTDGVYAFSLRRMSHAPGEYMLIPSNMIDDAPFRAQFGWRVQYIRKEGMYFLAVRNRQNRIVWELILTPDNLKNCLAQQKDAEAQPIDGMLDGYLMNTKFLARFSKEELKQMHAKLKALPSHTIISQTNMELIESEMEVVDYERFALINEDVDQSYVASGETKDYFAMVTYFLDLPDAMKYISDMGYSQPAIYGMWSEDERTFVVLPAEENCVVELWRAGLDEQSNVICIGDNPIVKGTPGKPLCFSYMVPEGIPDYMVVCRKPNGVASSWTPMFDGRDGSLMTNSDFIDGEPKG